MLVYVRPSNEALPRARVPGAQDQRGGPSHLFIVGALRVRRTVCLLLRIVLRPRVARDRRLSGSIPSSVLRVCAERRFTRLLDPTEGLADNSGGNRRCGGAFVDGSKGGPEHEITGCGRAG